MFKRIDRFIGRLLLPLLIRADLKRKAAKRITDQDTLVRFLFNRHKKAYARYGITRLDIAERITPKVKQGMTNKLIVWKARSVIKKAINEKRLVFMENGNVMYTDRLGRKDVMDMDAVSHVFIEKTGTQNDLAYFGMTEVDIKNILMVERDRRK